MLMCISHLLQHAGFYKKVAGYEYSLKSSIIIRMVKQKVMLSVERMVPYLIQISRLKYMYY